MHNLFLFIRRIVFIFVFFYGWQIPPALAGAIDNEQVSYGSACSGSGNGSDWDTIFQCNGSTWQRGPYFLGTTTDTCDANHAGMIRWNSSTSTVTYCNGSTPTWTAFGGNGLRPTYSGVSNASSVAIGFTYALYVDQSSNAYALGSEATGVLGNNTSASTYVSTPGLVNGGYSWTKVSAGELHSCGIINTGDAYCWGDNSVGEIGDGTTTVRLIPTKVTGGHNWVDIVVLGADASASSSNFGVGSGATYASCGITNTGAAYCWGANTSLGLLGNGSTAQSSTPVLVNGTMTWTSLAKGTGSYTGHMCGITNTGAAYCWGYDAHGELGNGFTTSTTPILVNNGYSWTQLAVGTNHTCGITNTNAAYCWGLNSSGQLGTNNTSTVSSPTIVNGSYSWSKIAAGEVHTCGITTGGVAYCWGDNFRSEGGLGPGSWNIQYTVPTAVLIPTGVSNTGWTDLSLGYYSSMGVNAGAIYSWGQPSNDNFGDPYYTNVLPVQSP